MPSPPTSPRPLAWFRMYADAIHDSKLRLLAFEDRWHFVAVLCMKASGLLDETGELRERRISVELGLTLREADEVKRRLCEVNLIGDDWQPLAWNSRQYQSDTSAERTRKYRERKSEEWAQRHCDVTVTPPETETETDKNTNTRARFAPPTIQDVQAFIAKHGYSVDPARFVDYYTGNGWKVGRTGMKDWQAVIRNWSRNNTGVSHASDNRPNGNPGADRSAAGRVRANVARELASIAAARTGGDGVATDGGAIRPPLD